MLTKEKGKRLEEDPSSDEPWAKKLRKKRKRIMVGKEGKPARVWSFVDDLVKKVADFYEYDTGAIRNIAIVYGLYYLVRNGKIPKDEDEFFKTFRAVEKSIDAMLSVYANAFHVTGGPVDFETALKIVEEQIRKEGKLPDKTVEKEAGDALVK